MTATPDPVVQHFMKAFSNPEAGGKYAEGPRRFVPGLEALHRMTGLLLAERAPDDATVLVLGAGGGLEMAAMASAHPGWRFVGVDPAPPMLDLAADTMGADAVRAQLVAGYIDDAPDGPFDAGVCLLTLHFLDAAERARTLKELRRRLTPGAPFVAAHSSFPQGEGERDIWVNRYASFAVSSGADPAMTEKARGAVAAGLNTFSPEQDAEIMAEAGFTDISLFYAAFTWRGWVAYA